MNATNGAPNNGERKPIMLFTNPRTASNLLQKLLSGQDKFGSSGYFLFDAAFKLFFEILNKGQRAKDTDATQWQQRMTAYQEGFEKLLKQIEEDRQSGRVPFIKEHVDVLVDPINLFKTAYPDDEGEHYVVKYPDQKGQPVSTSNLVVSDDFLLSVFPIILIRHPALMFPSFYRAQRDLGFDLNSPWLRIFMDLRWTEQLLVWYREHDVEPIVIDGDSVIKERAVVEKLCEMCGMEKEKIQWTWEPEKQPEDKYAVRFKSTLTNSTGIREDKHTNGLDIEEECGKWKAEFGEDIGGQIEVKVKNAMPYYSRLREQRLQA